MCRSCMCAGMFRKASAFDKFIAFDTSSVTNMNSKFPTTLLRSPYTRRMFHMRLCCNYDT